MRPHSILEQYRLCSLIEMWAQDISEDRLRWFKCNQSTVEVQGLLQPLNVMERIRSAFLCLFQLKFLLRDTKWPVTQLEPRVHVEYMLLSTAGHSAVLDPTSIAMA